MKPKKFHLKDFIITHIKDLENKFLLKKVNYNNLFKCFLTKQGQLFLKENILSNKKKDINLTKIDYNNLSKKHARILLNKNAREKLFWFLERSQGNQKKIGNLFNVHGNAVGNWKNGNTLIPSLTLNKMLLFLGENGINLIDEINTNIKEIETINGRYKISGGINHDVHICRPTFT